MKIRLWLQMICLAAFLQTVAQPRTKPIRFLVSCEAPASKKFSVSFSYTADKEEVVVFRMPQWTPGYYQMMHYAAQVTGFKATNANGDTLRWEKRAPDAWAIYAKKKQPFRVSYQVSGTRNFVAANYLDSTKAFIVPAGLFLYPENQLGRNVELSIHPFAAFKRIATGLDTVAGTTFTYKAPDFDVLYDSPILMGSALEELPSFQVKNIPHYFVAHQAGSFDQQTFMGDLKKIVEAASDIIGEIPYPHYTFLAIGPGGGGIEHLNSTAISFSGKGLENPENRTRMYSFLAHEHFHHYNAKRIRPIELGPFNYRDGSKTNMLWIAEGITVYYEHHILRRAGLVNDQHLRDQLARSIQSYEKRPGKKWQSVAEASAHTWTDGPFGGNPDSTISYYEKGPILAAMLDLKIRHETKNERTLDHLMRTLYTNYYKKQNRGFTEAEFRKEAERIAGVSLEEFFQYIYTTAPLDYNKYFGYAGLQVMLPENNTESVVIQPVAHTNPLQQKIVQSWTGNQQP